MREAGTPVAVPPADRIDGLEQRIGEALDSMKSYGLFYFLKEAAEQIKLIKILKETLPKYWEELLMLGFYLIGSDKPLMYMEDWITEHEGYPVGTMSSQRLSELLGEAKPEGAQRFFQGVGGSERKRRVSGC
jgi:hypothetical protein